MALDEGSFSPREKDRMRGIYLVLHLRGDGVPAWRDLGRMAYSFRGDEPLSLQLETAFPKFEP